jgi:MFS transporter, ACS family, D-galactonate transporter
MVIGFIVKGGDFKPALILVGCLGATGTLCYLLLVGKVERIETRDGEVKSGE